MTSIKELDSVLSFISTTTVWSELRKHFSKIDREDLRVILRKLRRDGYIDLLDDGTKLRGWEDERGYGDGMVIQKNFEGFLFEQEGGYQAKMSKEKTANIRLENLEVTQQKLSRKLNTLTAWIAAGTIAMVIMEIIKFIYEVNHPTC
ncbi:MAG TPA: hypothetical protein VHE59_13430 [Mucilaginibacter sp.]|nr:hypothetical protein [Mucilaginibacter sp.]